MKRVIPIRLEELEDRAPIADWTLDLQFISHSADPGLAAVGNVEGLPINIIYHRFSDIAPLGADPAFQALLAQHILAQLNQVHVPGRFRRAALALL